MIDRLAPLTPHVRAGNLGSMPAQRGKVLVVDDSATVRQQVRTVLEADGFAVLEAEDGRAALRALDGAVFDLLIVDVHMPEMDGITFVAEARKLAPHAKTPIFMLTTEASGGVAAAGRKAGATAWIVKPLDAENLRRGIAKVLG